MFQKVNLYFNRIFKWVVNPSFFFVFLTLKIFIYISLYRQTVKRLQYHIVENNTCIINP